ncbi:tetratricopeptide repeat protein [Nonlabens ulvanivorans]|uniref:tetratricopeptide repeat protein n=1 Tax=Nonlabens ulvanivorans TaxID=906888 RepID=UPI0037C67427
MKNITYLLFLFLIVIGCKSNLSDTEKKQVSELIRKAQVHRMNGHLDQAQVNYLKALEIDKKNTAIQYDLIGVYIEKDTLDLAFQVLKQIPEEERESTDYYHVEGGLYDYNGQSQKAIKSYQKALNLTQVPVVINQQDLNPLINYAMLETLAGKKEQGVNRLNNTLSFSWLAESDKALLQNFRNEFEYYQGTGVVEFHATRDFSILTNNPDSLEQVLKTHHINIKAKSTGQHHDSTEIFFSKKFKSGIEKLGIKLYLNNNL